MLNWDAAITVKTDYADKVTRVTLSRGHVSFNVFQKDDYWLVWVQAGDDVIYPSDNKTFSFDSAKALARTIYAGQWGVLCVLDRLGA